jgi:predicted nucleic acid-binding protein
MPTDTDAEARPVILLDTSAAIALIVEDHAAHAAVLDAIGGRRLGLAGHSWFETYSVLTRLPAPLRRSPADAGRLLAHNFPATAFLGVSEAAALGAELARLAISGGAVYDALVGAAARQHRRPLVTGDARARPVYEALGVDVVVIREVDSAAGS